METVKIVITGVYSAGKSSFIRAISTIDVVDTDFDTTLVEEMEQKQRTTVALDFGLIPVSDDIVLYLFGTPGQERFDFMWDHLTVGCLGYIVLVDSCRPESFAETRRLMARFAELTDAPFVVAANKQDDPRAMSPAQIRLALEIPEWISVLPCTSSDKERVKGVLLTLLEEILGEEEEADTIDEIAV